MRILVTGSSGHLGEALVRKLSARGQDVAGLDIAPGPATQHEGSIVDPAFVQQCMDGVTAVLHTATLHKPHVATHTRQHFVDVNISGTLNLLEAARDAKVDAFIFTSTTSVFGRAMSPAAGAPAVWIDETVPPAPKNIYGVTKLAAENLCELFHVKFGLPCLVLRTSRFFPEEDDSSAIRDGYDDENSKVNELTYRRVDIDDAAEAHFLALEKAGAIGFDRYIISATPPFVRDDLARLRADAPSVLRDYYDFQSLYEARGWRFFQSIDRVYSNAKARADLDWRPKIDFSEALRRLAKNERPFSDLTYAIGKKGYHEEVFEHGPYPTED